MQWVRNLILVGLAIVSYLLILAWQKDYGNTAPVTAAAPAVVTTATGSDLPAAPAAAAVAAGDIPPAPLSATAQPLAAAAQPLPTGLVHVKTDVLSVDIDPQGGDLVRVELPTYTRTVNSAEAFRLMENSPERVFVAQSGIHRRHTLVILMW